MKILKRILEVIGAIVFIFMLVLLISGTIMYKEAIDECSIEEKVAMLEQDENYVTIDLIPEIYKEAVIASEDHRFYKHNGIDVISTGRAILRDLTSLSYKQGGSTLTQQLAKNLYFTQRKKMSRKVAEMIMALKLESKLSKDKILELYINICYFGNGYYGLREASLGYFGVEPQDLTAYQATLLAGVPQSPNYYNLQDNLEYAKIRQGVVLSTMIEYEYITDDEALSILNGTY